MAWNTRFLNHRYPCFLLLSMGALGLLPSVACAHQAGSAPDAFDDTPDRGKILVQIGDQTVTESMVSTLLRDQLGNGDSETLQENTEARAAALASLIHRAGATHQLLARGGAPLRARIDHRLMQAVEAAKRIDPNAKEISEVDKATITWQVAWNEYLKQQLTETNLERFFTRFAYRYDGTEVKVSQIFLPKKNAALPFTAESSEAALDRIAKEIAEGKILFAAAAEEYSASPSAARGGAMGWIEGRGDLPAKVTEEAMTAPLNHVRGPLESKVGWHLILVTEKRPGRVAFREFVDRDALRRDAANFLFERLSREGLAAAKITWSDDRVCPRMSNWTAC